VATDRIEVQAPLEGDFQGVIRVVVGGIAERSGFGFEELDDLQLAVERLLATTDADGSVRLRFDVGERSVRLRVGPLRESALAEALQGPEASGTLTLRRVLETVVDSYGVELSPEGDIIVRLEKLRGPR
jgi:ferric-dicitrate binding protein FerR (iron transport regulator)